MEGVTGDTAKPRATTFEVTGDFHAADARQGAQRRRLQRAGQSNDTNRETI